MKEKRFTPDEFEDLLKKASERCLQYFLDTFSAGEVSKIIKYVIPELQTDLLSPQQLLKHILRDDGMFRPTIRLSPFARTATETVICVSWGDDAMDFEEWVDVLPPEDIRFKFEPFVVMSPDLNDLSDEDLKRHQSGEPIVSKISLPLYEKKRS